MPYLVKAELKSVIDMYALDAIVDNDDTIIEMAIAAAVEEVANMFTPNEKKEWLDGRPIYDVAAIFATEGTGRNALMLQHTKIVAGWHIVLLNNAATDFDKMKSAYDRTKTSLKELATGVTNSLTLPRLAPPAEDGSEGGAMPWRYGSRPKFNHG